MTQSRKPFHSAENADPHELNNPVPLLLLGLIAALVVWGAYYIFSSNPDGLPALGDQREPSALAAGASNDEVIDGRQIFTIACQACHQAGGQGLPGVFPPLAGAGWVTGEAEILIRIVMHGMTGPVTVAGATYNGAMPAFGSQFNDAELAAVLSFIRSEWGNDSPPIEAASVAAIRTATQDRDQPWAGEEELLRLAAETAGQRP